MRPGQLLGTMSSPLPYLQSWGIGTNLLRSILGHLQVKSKIFAVINESVDLLIQRCGSIAAYGPLNMVLRWPCEACAVVILTFLHIAF